MTWADPDRRGTRTHHVYWSDGTSSFALITVGSPQEVVTLAALSPCSGVGRLRVEYWQGLGRTVHVAALPSTLAAVRGRESP